MKRKYQTTPATRKRIIQGAKNRWRGKSAKERSEHMTMMVTKRWEKANPR